MVVQKRDVQGGIAAVIERYYGSRLEDDYEMIYVEGYRDGGKLAKLVQFLKGYIRYTTVLYREEPDLIHIHSSFGPSFVRKSFYVNKAYRMGIPVINHIHGADFDEFYEKAGKLKRRRIHKVYNRCNMLIALSEEWRSKLAKIVPKEKICTIENYSVPQSRELINSLEESRYHAKQVLFLGEIGARKGAYDLPAIVQAVKRRVPEVRFVICGSGEIRQVKEQLSDETVGSVAFPGWVRGDAKDRYLKESSLFLLPSYQEGMPMSILDAMGYGLPIVSTYVGGIPKLVSEENGILCEPGDAAGIADAIIKVLEDRDLQHKMGLGSLEYVEVQYSLEMHLQKLEAVYEITMSR